MARHRIEHVNVTVSDAARSAALMERIFGWHVRWKGPARDDGTVVHVGTEDHYLALYTPPGERLQRYKKGEPLNHVGIEVDDLQATEEKVIAAGLTPFAHGDYEPGRRFYFLDPDGIEYEVVSYQLSASSNGA
jgi:catechol 2,3-dioxygenase-like lactoylglutathione lyase family enzyme